MNKLNSLSASHYKVEAVGAPLDENLATPPQADYKIQQPTTLSEKPITPPDYEIQHEETWAEKVITPWEQPTSLAQEA